MFGSLDSATLIARALVLVVAFSVHEFAHAWMADYFGDSTPREQGRLTLNPLKHLDPIGSLLLLVAGFGWARPVIVNPYVLAQAAPSAIMWVALAGPLSNLLLAVIGSIPFRFGLVSLANGSAGFLPSLDHLFTEFVWINLILLFFNLLPIAPLDGEKVAMHLLPPAGREVFMRFRPYSWMVLLLIVFLVPQVLSILVGLPASFLLNLLVG
ncbi:MAG TPA: site-2 protease family protein [Anaerolineales bacterium]|nr:site-2 protease family protein [Anaerolineales bacterium]